MKKIHTAPRGTADILPADAALWQTVESRARERLASYGYREIRTPLFEETELFARSVGQTSDIVQKQMLNLAAQHEDEGAEDPTRVALSLRPEATAAVVRAYIEHHLDRQERLSKLFYVGPMFRGERPQKGRLRQFHQIGVEALGPETASPFLDAEVIALSVDILKSLSVQGFELRINTLGTAEDKERFSGFLRGALGSQLTAFCPDCQSRFSRNVFRILDCKNRDCQRQIDRIELDRSYLTEGSRQYFDAVKAALDSLGIGYREDPRLVRGLDYYTHTVFEVSCASLGSQDAVGAGGRYNGLVEQLGGPKADAVGFALGIERILLACDGDQLTSESGIDVFVVVLDEGLMPRAFEMLDHLRRAGIRADMGFSAGSLKSQMRQADKNKARFVWMLGSQEASEGVVTVKNMETSSQERVRIDDLGSWITAFHQNGR